MPRFGSESAISFLEVNGLGFQLFPAIGGALRMKKEPGQGCNAAAPKTIFNNVYESKQVAIKTQILGLKTKPKCGEQTEMPATFDTTESMIKMCKDIGNFRYSNELVCHDEIINWALSVTTKEKLSTHLDKACATIIERMKTKHKLVTNFPYHPFEDVKFSKAYWTYLVTMGDVGPDALALDCDPDATFSSSGSINDVCIDIPDLRAVTPCERDPQSATCHVSKVTGLTGKPTGAKVAPPKDDDAAPATTGDATKADAPGSETTERTRQTHLWKRASKPQKRERSRPKMRSSKMPTQRKSRQKRKRRLMMRTKRPSRKARSLRKTRSSPQLPKMLQRRKAKEKARR